MDIIPYHFHLPSASGRSLFSGNVRFIQIFGQHLKVDPVQAPQASCVAHQHTIRIVPHFQFLGHGPRKVHRVEAKGLYFLVLESQPNGVKRYREQAEEKKNPKQSAGEFPLLSPKALKSCDETQRETPQIQVPKFFLAISRCSTASHLQCPILLAQLSRSHQTVPMMPWQPSNVGPL